MFTDKIFNHFCTGTVEEQEDGKRQENIPVRSYLSERRVILELRSCLEVN